MKRAVAIGLFGTVLSCASCGSNGVPAKQAAEPVAAKVDAGHSDPPPPPSPPEPTSPREEKLIAKMLTRVSKARGLAATKPVPGVTLSRDALIAKVKEHVAREIPPEAIRQEGLVLQLLGMIPTSFDYEKETFALLEAQLAGFYEPSDGTMYMAADLDEDNAEATLAHELVHALQDQHFDLKPHSKYVEGKSDEQAAFSALAEGDATSAMADVLVARAAKGKTALDLPEEVFVEQVLGSVSTGAAAKAPHVMRTSLVAPYIYGTLFVHALRRHGGWSAVDQAWRDLPTTTEQILHVDKWRAHEAALSVATPTFAALGAGWKQSDDDTFGELGLRLSYEEWIGADAAGEVASAWGGDRGVLVENGATAALALHVRYDASREPGGDYAKRAFAQLARGIETKVGKASAKDAGFVCIERAELGPLAIVRSGRDLVLIAGPTKSGGAWTSAGNCALAKKWGAEILKP